MITQLINLTFNTSVINRSPTLPDNKTLFKFILKICNVQLCNIQL